MKLMSLEIIIRALSDANVRYMIVGGLAVAAHGYGRVTFDLDLVVQLRPDNVKRAMKALESLGTVRLFLFQSRTFPMQQSGKGGSGRRRWLFFHYRATDTPIDLFVSEPFDFDLEYDKAMIGEALPGLHLRFVSLETLIRMKESTGREKDREDVRQLKLLLEDRDNAE